jgi:hypothetical protein
MSISAVMVRAGDVRGWWELVCSCARAVGVWGSGLVGWLAGWLSRIGGVAAGLVELQLQWRGWAGAAEDLADKQRRRAAGSCQADIKENQRQKASKHNTALFTKS